MLSTSPSLLPLLALLASQSLCFQFTFPISGKVDYKFSEGDIAIVEWSPKDKVIQELALVCGPELGIDNDTPAYTILNTDLPSGVHYNIPHTWTGSNNKYCMFCTGNSNKVCSGIFLLQNPSKGSRLMVHALNGSYPQEQQPAGPATTITLITTTKTTTTTASTLESTTTTTQITQVKSLVDTTTCTTHLPPIPTQTQQSVSHEPVITSTTSILPIPTNSGGTGAIPTTLCTLSAGSTCNASSILFPSFNFPSVPTASLQPDSGVSSSRDRKSTMAGVVAIGILAFWVF